MCEECRKAAMAAHEANPEPSYLRRARHALAAFEAFTKLDPTMRAVAAMPAEELRAFTNEVRETYLSADIDDATRAHVERRLTAINLRSLASSLAELAALHVSLLDGLASEFGLVVQAGVMTADGEPVFPGDETVSERETRAEAAAQAAAPGTAGTVTTFRAGPAGPAFVDRRDIREHPDGRAPRTKGNPDGLVS